MDGVLRQRLRKERSRLQHLKVGKRHVEFCSECGRACDRTGRRNESRCLRCAKPRRDE